MLKDTLRSFVSYPKGEIDQRRDCRSAERSRTAFRGQGGIASRSAGFDYGGLTKVSKPELLPSECAAGTRGSRVDGECRGITTLCRFCTSHISQYRDGQNDRPDTLVKIRAPRAHRINHQRRMEMPARRSTMVLRTGSRTLRLGEIPWNGGRYSSAPRSSVCVEFGTPWDQGWRR